VKWIGQHIYDLISRFRNDVYLEDVSTGTIASGGNLGLDSNNKIVKATETTGDITAVSITTDSGVGSRGQSSSGTADFSILGNDGVGVTNSTTTITVTAVPGEIDHDSLLNFEAGRHFTQAGITTVGTIGTGVWQGTAIATAYIAGDAINGDKIADDAVDSEHYTDGSIDTAHIADDAVTENKLANTLLAEIDANTAKSTNRAYFEFKGYGSSDGTNYEMPEIISDNNAPFEHNTSTGSDGLTAQAVTVVMRQGGVVMPYTGTLKSFNGWVTTQGTGTVDIGIFKFTPVDNNASTVTPVLLVNEQITGAGNTKMRYFSETSSFDAGFTAGDVLYSAVLGSGSGKSWYLNSMLEVEWSKQNINIINGFKKKQNIRINKSVVSRLNVNNKRGDVKYI
jgi:hypothetical protein